MDIKRADVLAQSELNQRAKLEKVKSLQRYYEEVLEQGMCTRLKELAVTGTDLIKEGMKPGREIGKVLEKMLEAVLENPDMNEKETLMALAKRWGYI